MKIVSETQNTNLKQEKLKVVLTQVNKKSK